MPEQHEGQSPPSGEGRGARFKNALTKLWKRGGTSARNAAAESPLPRTSLAEFFSTGSGDRTYWISENRPTDFTSHDDLLGTARSTDIRGEADRIAYQRPTWEYTQGLQQELRTVAEHMSDDEMHNFITNQLPAVLLAIAEIRLPLQDIHTTTQMIRIVQRVYEGRRSEKWGKEFKTRHGLESPDETSSQTTTMEKVPDDNNKKEKLDVVRLGMAQQLVYRTAFQEGLLGPNDLGYLPDTTSSLANNESALVESIGQVARILAEQPTLFGERTRDIYEGFTKRLNKTRAMFHGVRVNPKDFPPFPVPSGREETDS